MKRKAVETRKTRETFVEVTLSLDETHEPTISTGIPFLDHMLTLFGVHGFFGLSVKAKGDIEVDYHHTVEDVGIVLGSAFNSALGDRSGIHRFGFASTPMDESLAQVTVDLSKRPYLVYQVPPLPIVQGLFGAALAKEFFRAFSVAAGMNLHIQVLYGENEHHVLEAIFKSLGRAMGQACGMDPRVKKIRSSKGVL